MSYTVAAFYRFTPLQDLPRLRQEWRDAFADHDLCGSLLLAPEGINGTLAGDAAAIDALLERLRKDTGLSRDEVKFSESPGKPFGRFKIRLKREIITFKQADADPTKQVGDYVDAQDWNALLDDPEVTVLDTRNQYETSIGIFAGAHDPAIDKFTDFAGYVRANLDPARHKKIAMYCTGGIRCEKASAFMLAEGFERVYHLKGGILKYLETIPADQSRWQGECYVFDRRVSVGHGLAAGHYGMCFTCGRPVDDMDRAHPLYEEGVSCAACHGATGEEDKARYRMRQQQMTQTDAPHFPEMARHDG